MRFKLVLTLVLVLLGSLSWQVRAEVEYVKFKPFVVNYGKPGGRLQYLKVELQVAVGSIEASKALEHHRPDVRNDLVMYLSGLDNSVVKAPDGREQIMKGTLEVIRQTMQTEINHPLAEQVLIQNLVYQ